MKKYLLTGASGFLGKVIFMKIKNECYTLGRSQSDDVLCDLESVATGIPEVKTFIHCAGKAHIIPKTVEEKEAFFKINYKGTVNLLKGFERSGNIPQNLIFISTVAVYGLEEGEGIDESSPLLGETPYAKSKIMAETYLKEWCNLKQVNLVILRLPLIVGENAPGNLGAMERAIQNGYYLGIGTGSSRKSAVLAKDIADLIPRLEGVNGTFNLTDQRHPSMREIEEALAEKYQKKIRRIPLLWLKPFAAIGDKLSFFPLNSYRLEKLTSSLTFDDDLAKKQLKWNPGSVLEFLKSE
ncbi:MAG: NAD-dependent epimerase/dehydratase family protein [Mongoliibacter sp.]|uniref:NAD-dependent epimerase/dehydratase family protein n=1 Tax=Mongoliibacter sp. TaxID=2022438 RepID=UPI0012EEEC39|nr:NAD-dependent epimerase/dehydratase family protein [Mongoliibacter sp.]TVP46543.1 MAG: NAD-dependent epimerase/dehydratase family protein [Mongoliibacter sp.]